MKDVNIVLVVLLAVNLPLSLLTDHLAKKMVAYKCRQYQREQPAFIQGPVWLLLLVVWYLILTFSGTQAFIYLGLPGMVLVMVFAVTGIIIGLTDYYVRLIPNEMLLILLPFILGYQVLYFWMAKETWWYLPLSFGAVILLLQCPNWVTGKMVVAPGDVKFALLMSLGIAGSRMVTALLVFSCAFLVYAGIGLALRSLKMRSYFPLGGFLAAGLTVGAIWRLNELTRVVEAFLTGW